MVVYDPSNLASETYALAASSEPIAALVKEALEVIDDALDEYGYATHFHDHQPVISAIFSMHLLTACLLVEIKSL
jgi:hypothetical protein